MLMLLASALAVASCRDPLVESTEREAPALSVVQQQTGLRLTYLCGNRFRIRTTRRDTVRVRWDVYNTADTGSVLVPGIEGAMTQRDVDFETRVRGTTRIFLGAQLVDTKANGGLACRPSLAAPRHRALPSDSTLLISDSAADPPRVFYRTFVHVLFRDEASDADINAFLQRFGASLYRSGSDQRAFVVELPDLGQSMRLLRERYERILRDPAVRAALLAEATPSPFTPSGGRFPDDGSTGIPRNAWLSAPSIRSWALRAVRGNLGWGCETGMYGSDDDAAAIGILEARLPIVNVDLTHSVRRTSTPLSAVPFVTFDPLEAAHRAHATEVAGVVAAEGDNGYGGAGIVWRANVRLAAVKNSAGNQADAYEYFDELLPELAAGGTRVVNLSTHGDYARDSAEAEQALALYERIVSRFPNTLFVVSTGQAPRGQPGRSFSTVPTHADVKQTKSGAFGNVLLFHFTRLKQLGYRNIIMVGGAELDGSAADVVPRVRRYYEGDWVSASTGAGVDIVAPAKDVYTVSPVAGNAPGAVAVDGTSFAAPMVAGAAVAALSMDPSLTAAELRELILRSAKDSIVDGHGATIGKQPVHDGVYLLDVYNLLRRVAQRRPGLPLCGTPVRTDGVAGRVLIGAGSDAIAVPVPELAGFAQQGSTLSVAPGGRRIAATVFTTPAGTFRPVELTLSNGQWTAAPVRNDANAIVYADGDTILLRSSLADGDVVWEAERRGRRAARRTLLLPWIDIPRRAVSSISVDPTGRFVFAAVNWFGDADIACGVGTAGSGAAIEDLDTGDRSIVRAAQFDACSPPTEVPTRESPVAWSPNGERAWSFESFVRTGVGGGGTHVTALRRAGGRFTPDGARRTLPGWFVNDARTSLDGGTIGSHETGLGGEGCRLRRLKFADPFVPMGAPEAVECATVEQLRLAGPRASRLLVQRRGIRP